MIKIRILNKETYFISNQLGYISHGEYLKNGFTPGKYFEV